MKETSQILPLTSLMPTFWPANTALRLILRFKPPGVAASLGLYTTGPTLATAPET